MHFLTICVPASWIIILLVKEDYHLCEPSGHDKLLFIFSHHILLMDNDEDSAEYVSRLNTCFFSTKCLMSLENTGVF